MDDQEEHENSASAEGETDAQQNKNDKHEEEFLNYSDPIVSGMKICLTSRNKKRVLINEVQRSEDIVQIENKINELENSFKFGINEIRQSVQMMEDEKHSMEVHVKSLESSLKYCNTNNKECKAMNEQLKMEIDELKESLQKLKATNNHLLDDNESILSEHSVHLQSIANQQRRKRIAKRTFDMWKRKLKNKDGNLVLLLQAENRRIREELIKYQEDAKQAFLRSVKTLNSEALSMFQNSNTRLLQSDYLMNDCIVDDHDDAKSSFSESSAPSSIISTTLQNRADDNETEVNNRANGEHSHSMSQNEIFFQRSPNQKNGSADRQYKEKKYSRFGSNSFSEKDDLEGRKDKPAGPDRSETVGFKDNVYDKIRLGSKGDWIEPNYIDRSPGRVANSSHRRATSKSYIADYVPDALRKETRQIMTHLQNTKKQNIIRSASESLNMCRNNSHVHICHCAPQPGKPVSCQYCSAKQNFNFSKMPLGTRLESNIVNKRQACQTKNEADYKKSRNVVITSLTPNKENKSKTIYQPFGSSVVIEKHIN